MAPGWGEWAAEMETANAPVRAWLLRELDPRPGDTVLELSAGAGETGFEIARPLGEHGRLISSDFASEMVDVAQRRGNELGLRNVAPISFRASAIGSWRRWRRRKRIHRSACCVRHDASRRPERRRQRRRGEGGVVPSGMCGGGCTARRRPRALHRLHHRVAPPVAP
jgi:Methyltransferase domain